MVNIDMVGCYQSGMIITCSFMHSKIHNEIIFKKHSLSIQPTERR